MDPDITLQELLQAIRDGDVPRARELSAALKGWLDNQGFPPKTIGPWKLGQDWHFDVAKAICRLAVRHARRLHRSYKMTDEESLPGL